MDAVRVRNGQPTLIGQQPPAFRCDRPSIKIGRLPAEARVL
jgi:hypothetical protein